VGVALSAELKDVAGAELMKQLGAALPSSLAKATAEDLVIATQDHLRELDTRGNRLGGQRTHFYGEAASNTTGQAEGDQVRVSINKQGIRQRFFGGEIKPVNRKFLTIPARAEAHGKTAREFNNLRFVMFGPDTAALIEAERTDVEIRKPRGKGKLAPVSERARSAGGGVMFWLVRSVTQNPDPEVVPSKEKLGAVLRESAGNYMAALAQVNVRGAQ
jgi:hypothetical protein